MLVKSIIVDHPVTKQRKVLIKSIIVDHPAIYILSLCFEEYFEKSLFSTIIRHKNIKKHINDKTTLPTHYHLANDNIFFEQISFSK